jgi:hypothetical protein
MKNIFAYLILFIAIVSFPACKDVKKDPAPDQPAGTTGATGTVKVEFDNQFKQDAIDPEVYVPLEFDKQIYKNVANQDYSISMFKYYISNVKLKKQDGSYYAVPESYFLIDAKSSPDELITLLNIPEGSYIGISYMVGVDSTHNVSGAQTGTLDKANSMFWDWNTGYIFLKLEGSSPQSSDTVGRILQYHIGGFRNTTNTNALQTINLDFGTSVLNVTKVGTPKVHIMVEASKVADNIDFSTTPEVHMPGASAIKISQSYANMFRFDHVHN